MILEFHAIQSFAPANLNRDDTGAPKDCVFGGVRRARISSQSLKRAIRNHFNEARVDRGVRSRRLAAEIARRLMAGGTDEATALARARLLLASKPLGLKVDAGDDGELTTAQLVFLREEELDRLAEIGAEHAAALDKQAAKDQPVVPAQVAKAVKEALTRGGRGLDVALFGRMVAEFPEANVDAACQVAHALGTHRLAADFDYYTAVDDLQPDDNAGAEMLGTIQFNASCVYRYAALETGLLRRNLGPSGSSDDVALGVERFADAFARAIPTGKQNTFAAHNPPVAYLALRRRTGAWNLANAFVRPVVAGESDIATESVRAMLRELSSVQRAYGDPGDELAGVLLRTTAQDDAQLPEGVRVVASLGEVLEFVGGAAASA